MEAHALSQLKTDIAKAERLWKTLQPKLRSEDGGFAAVRVYVNSLFANMRGAANFAGTSAGKSPLQKLNGQLYEQFAKQFTPALQRFADGSAPVETSEHMRGLEEKLSELFGKFREVEEYRLDQAWAKRMGLPRGERAVSML